MFLSELLSALYPLDYSLLVGDVFSKNIEEDIFLLAYFFFFESEKSSLFSESRNSSLPNSCLSLSLTFYAFERLKSSLLARSNMLLSLTLFTNNG
jgi:hypothetical protein